MAIWTYVSYSEFKYYYTYAIYCLVSGEIEVNSWLVRKKVIVQLFTLVRQEQGYGC